MDYETTSGFTMLKGRINPSVMKAPSEVYYKELLNTQNKRQVIRSTKYTLIFCLD